MRILHADTDDLGNPLRGGQPVRTYQINSRLAQDNQITVFTATYKGCQREHLRDGIRYRRLGLRIPGSGLSPHLSFLGCLPYAVKTTPHDLVVEEFTPPTGFCMLPWWTKKPVVSMVQWFFFRDWERRYKLPFESMMRSLSRRADYRHFIVQTDRMGDYFRELMPDVRIWKVPCGIGDEAFHAAQDDGAYALFLGRLDLGHKGLDYLIETWRRLATAGTRIPLKIAGAGPAEDWLHGKIAQHGLADCIELVGRIEGPEKETLLRNCRFLVMPSRQETFGLSALEAMATGRPVLAFDIPHLNEVVRPAWGALATLGDIEAFSAKAAELWTNPEHARALGAAGYSAAQAYRWDALAQKQMDIYREVVAMGAAA